MKTPVAFLILGIATLWLIAATVSTQSLAAQATSAIAAGTEEVLCPPSASTAAPGATMTVLAAGVQSGTETPPIARPSNPGGPGLALNLTGDAKAGEKIYVAYCQQCHGDQGQGGVANPGSDDGSIPALNPIDDTLKDLDPKVYACNIDLFIEHGSVPSGPNPQQIMHAFGDEGRLKPQDIADVMAYVMSLNPLEPTAEATSSAQ